MLVTAETFTPQKARGFIVLEGLNGAGKSSLQKRLAEALRSLNKKVVTTFEPGDSPYGKQIRSIVLGQGSPALEPLSELLLFAADRFEHVQKVILPALAREEFVLCDRYSYSTIAFQGYGRQLALDQINSLNSLATAGLTPDLVILLDCPPELGLSRTKGRQTEDAKDSFEQETLAFHQRLRTGFLTMAKQLPEPFAVIDATLSADEVFTKAFALIQKLVSPLS